ncbi:MAG: hypothetical protein JNK82_00435, partial [Myxococcaceae bacterium]|nr:hypothetical protein [Myxococcaceae bacterium]
MKRLALIAASLPVVVMAHVVEFDLQLPAYVGNYPSDGGIYALEWTDVIAPGPKASVTIFGTRAALSPFDAPDGSVIASDISPSSPVNVFDWDTTTFEDGCWQPYAIIDDPIEGRSITRGEGRITVANGGNVPPAIWVTTPRAALPGPDRRLALEWALDEPDDPSLVSVVWRAGDGEEGTLVAGLPLSAGTRSATYAIDVRRLPPKPIFLRVIVSSGDAGWCDAWWGGFVTGRSDELVDGGTPSDAGIGTHDAGSGDAGSLPPDAGEPPLPADAGTEPSMKAPGCGCNSAEGFASLAMSI